MQVNVVRASQLAIKDAWKMSSDPFCRLHFGNLKERTKTVQRDLNPIWNETFAFSLDEDKEWLLRDLVVNVWDDDFGGISSDFLGEVPILDSLLDGAAVNFFLVPETNMNTMVLRLKFQCGY